MRTAHSTLLLSIVNKMAHKSLLIAMIKFCYGDRHQAMDPIRLFEICKTAWCKRESLPECGRYLWKQFENREGMNECKWMTAKFENTGCPMRKWPVECCWNYGNAQAKSTVTDAPLDQYCSCFCHSKGSNRIDGTKLRKRTIVEKLERVNVKTKRIPFNRKW